MKYWMVQAAMLQPAKTTIETGDDLFYQ